MYINAELITKFISGSLIFKRVLTVGVAVESRDKTLDPFVYLLMKSIVSNRLYVGLVHLISHMGLAGDVGLTDLVGLTNCIVFTEYHQALYGQALFPDCPHAVRVNLLILCSTTDTHLPVTSWRAQSVWPVAPMVALHFLRVCLNVQRPG